MAPLALLLLEAVSKEGEALCEGEGQPGRGKRKQSTIENKDVECSKTAWKGEKSQSNNINMQGDHLSFRMRNTSLFSDLMMLLYSLLNF